jgi:hypothetical protein
MFTKSEIPPETIQAYRETNYCVLGESPFVLRVTVHSEPLAHAYIRYRVDCAAFLTACNPFSEVISAADNDARQTELEEVLVLQGLDYLPGSGEHPSGDWIAEPSYFVPGLSLDDVKALGRKFDQNAVVWCGSDAIPQLVLLR